MNEEKNGVPLPQGLAGCLQECRWTWDIRTHAMKRRTLTQTHIALPHTSPARCPRRPSVLASVLASVHSAQPSQKQKNANVHGSDPGKTLRVTATGQLPALTPETARASQVHSFAKAVHELLLRDANTNNDHHVPSELEMFGFAFDIVRRIRAIDGTALVALVFLERLLTNVNELKVTARNWQALVTTAILLASKVCDDTSMVNVDFADFLPFSLKEINHWERRFLAGIEYNVSCSIVQYNSALFRAMGPSIHAATGPGADTDHLEASKVAADWPRVLRRVFSAQPHMLRCE